jgi:hypothetical protein
MMLDYALGGGWPLSGMVNGSAMQVDWVRAYSLPIRQAADPLKPPHSIDGRAT